VSNGIKQGALSYQPTFSVSKSTLPSSYKEQQYSERGWHFLKATLFFTSSLFLKTPQRIMALAMVMGLALMV
jgi:transposase